MLDITDLYAIFMDRQEEPEIPADAPHSVILLLGSETRYITRVEKRLARKLNYGETRKLLAQFHAKGPETRPFVKRHIEDQIPF